ncbi:MAG TPA: dodecin family protein [Longimicrobiales bacterium]|nr:dodecin family protein [Longimicrobiales bacterium]
MAVVKVIEIISDTHGSIEEAVEAAVREASETVKDIKEVWVSSIKATCDGENVTGYRVNTKISFVVKSQRD